MTIGHPFSTRRGRRLRQAKLRSTDWLCERCRAAGKFVPATEVHHRVRLQDGGPPYPPLDRLEALCDEHHGQRHGSKPKVGVDPATGLPIGAGHWWNTQ